MFYYRTPCHESDVQAEAEKTDMQKGSSQDRSLTRRQMQVLIALSDGLTSAETGTILGISPRTVEGLRKELNHIAGVHNRVLLVRWAIRHGLVRA